MSDDTARALGAGDGGDGITIGGISCTLRPLTAKELAEVTRDCVKQQQQAYLETFGASLKLVPGTDESRAELMRSEIRDVAKWQAADLEPRKAYDATRIKITDDLRAWLSETHNIVTNGQVVPDGDTRTRIDDPERLARMAAASLDMGQLKPTAYKVLTGESPASLMIDFVSWWITGSLDGQISLCWHCFKHNGVSRDDVAAEMGMNPAKLIQAARDIEHLSVPSVENG